MTPIQKSVSVILPNFNGEILLKDYLPAVYEALKFSPYISGYEIIIIDDASTDNSVDFIGRNFDDIILLKNEVNSGFAKSINRGIYAATSDLVLLLNTDMYLPEDFFNHLIPYFSDNEALFGVSPAIKNKNGDLILEAQKLPRFKSSSFHYVDNIGQDKSSYSLYLCGGCALVDRNKLLMLNGFSEIYSPFYFEDFDLSVRAWLQNWQCLYSPETYVLHCHSATINSNFSKDDVRKVFTRNKLIFNYLYTYGLTHFLFWCRSYAKFLWGIIAPSRSKKIFNVAFKHLKKNLLQLKLIKKGLTDSQKISLKEVCSLYFTE